MELAAHPGEIAADDELRSVDTPLCLQGVHRTDGVGSGVDVGISGLQVAVDIQAGDAVPGVAAAVVVLEGAQDLHAGAAGGLIEIEDAVISPGAAQEAGIHRPVEVEAHQVAAGGAVKAG